MLHTDVFAFILEELLDLVTNFALRNLDIVLGRTIIGHEREETIVGDIELHQQSVLMALLA